MHRRQFVLYHGSKSSEKEVDVGVPQGCVLGPLLFILYFNDLYNYVNLFHIEYADDLTMIASNKNAEKMIEDLNNNLNSVAKYCKSFNLAMNQTKTVTMEFHPYSAHYTKSKLIKLNCKSVEQVASFKLLALKRHGGLRSTTVAEGYIFNNKIKTASKIFNNVKNCDVQENTENIDIKVVGSSNYDVNEIETSNYYVNETETKVNTSLSANLYEALRGRIAQRRTYCSEDDDEDEITISVMLLFQPQIKTKKSLTNKAMDPIKMHPQTDLVTSTLKKEMSLFENGGSRVACLKLKYDFLMSPLVWFRKGPHSSAKRKIRYADVYSDEDSEKQDQGEELENDSQILSVQNVKENDVKFPGKKQLNILLEWSNLVKFF
ncbi:unnamed protein product [Brassicogethes aeneus]|uniref:Reverse transcriptase domain-containing protein n=1 Tax=Brassicogethes aeneus TaxID=1431903 RepID=A0A9P0AQQ3_BRAAE|nr:unnamed protein product [Brassicogethes aeneus]